jgi:hypothetical protein
MDVLPLDVEVSLEAPHAHYALPPAERLRAGRRSDDLLVREARARHAAAAAAATSV